MVRRQSGYLAGLRLFAALVIAGGDGFGAEASPPEVVRVPAGPFVAGSDREEREAAYRLDEAAYGHDATRRGGWYEAERPHGVHETLAFAITRTPITNAQYAAFVAATGHPAPDVAARTWAGYGLNHPFMRTRRHAWRDGRPPPGREEHPVVLVSYGDAEAFAAWLRSTTGRHWRLSTEDEWEKAARGTDGRRFLWGDAYDADRLNSHDRGPFDTRPVGSFPDGASPYQPVAEVGCLASTVGMGRRQR